LDNAILQCRRCTLKGDCGEFGSTLPNGYNDAEIMVIGRNPNFNDLIGGELSSSRVGEKLLEFLDSIGLTSRDCWITNVNKCYSQNDRPTTIGEIAACSSHLKSEIKLIKPKFIIALGNEATAMLTPYGYSASIEHCGDILDKPTGILGSIDAWVAVCVHPSIALRSQSGELNMEYAAEQIKGFLDERRYL